MNKLLTAALLVAMAGPAVASEGDDPTSLSYISYLERYATIQPSTQADSVEAVIKMPLVPGDRVDTAREARMEVVLADGNLMWLDEYTTVSLDAVAFSRDSRADRTVLYLAEGSVVVEVSEHTLTREPVRIDGRSATVYLSDIGLYRIQALPTGGLRIEVWEGLAEAVTTSGGVLVRAESATEIDSGTITGSELAMTWEDDFAQWVEQRRRVVSGESSQYVDTRFGRQAAHLDTYGSWVYVAEYNTWAWQPYVDSSWRPYTAGRWYWTPTGWSWISYEPWGWLPYHYGSWYFSVGFGWVWGWGSHWGPAWVNWCWWPGYVGWCPSGYYWGWYWPRYCHYYGYPRWPYRPGYPGYPGGGGTQTPRRDVIPRPGAGGGGDAGGDGAVRRASLSRPQDVDLDLKGRVRVGDMDRVGWNVVSDRDFSSPHLSRLVRSGDDALRGRTDTGVVMSGPLRTASPTRMRPSDELQRVFREVERSEPRDITPIMARDDSLQAEDALRMVKPSTAAEVSRRSAAVAASIDSAGSRQSSGARPRDPQLTTRDGSPLHGATGRRPADSYRSDSGGSSTAGRTQGSPDRNPFVPRSRPSTLVTPPESGRSSVGTRQSPAREPTASGRTIQRRSPVTRTAPSVTRRSGTSPTRPVIVPRTNPTAPRSSAGSRSAPSRNPTASSPPRSSSGRSSSARPPSQSAGSRSSSGRSGGGGASAPRSSSSGSRSSSGARRQ
jgi:hypothetical protein